MSHQSTIPSVSKRVNLTLSPAEFTALKSLRSQSGASNSRVTTFVHELVMARLASELRSAKPETLAKVKADLIASGISVENANAFLGAFRNGEKTQESTPSVHSLVPGKPVSSSHVDRPSLLPIPKPALKSSPVLVNRKPSAVHPLGYPVKSLSKVHQTFIGAAFFGGDQNQDGLEYGSSPAEDDRPVPLPSALPSSSSPDLNTINLKSLTRPCAHARVDIAIDSGKSDGCNADDSADEVTSVTPMQAESETVTRSAITRRSPRKADQTVAPCAARAAKKQVPLIPVQLTPRAQECLDEMRRLGGPFAEMEPDVQEHCAAEADKLLRPSKDIINAAKKYYGWWTNVCDSKRHKDTKRGWIRWVTNTDSGIYDPKPFTPQTFAQQKLDREARVKMWYRIKQRMDCKKINDLRRAAGEPIKEGFDDWDPEVAGLKLEDYE